MYHELGRALSVNNTCHGREKCHAPWKYSACGCSLNFAKRIVYLREMVYEDSARGRDVVPHNMRMWETGVLNHSTAFG